MNVKSLRWRPWLRFSLRSLFVLVTAACVWLGWHMHRVNTQRDVRKQLQSLGVTLPPPDADHVRVPKWLRGRLDADHFASYSRTGLSGPNLDGERLGRIVDQLARLPALRSLSIDAHRPLTHDAYRQLARLDQVETLYIHMYASVSGSDLAPLTEMRSLRSLEFEEAYVQPSALKTMAAIGSLEELRVPTLADDWRRWFENRRPDLRVFHTDNYAP